MKINITDIGPEGRELAFELDVKALNDRACVDRVTHDAREEILPPQYLFRFSRAELKLMLEGSTVLVNGGVAASYTTSCSRCAEETEKQIQVPVNIVLKPLPAREEDRVEDVALGFYNGREVECDSIVEESLILSLPFTVLCSEGCLGLCPTCGINLNQGPCGCPPRKSGDERFAVLRELKIQ